MLLKLSLPITHPMILKLNANLKRLPECYIEESITGMSLLYSSTILSKTMKYLGRAYVFKYIHPLNKSKLRKGKELKRLNRRLQFIISPLSKHYQYFNPEMLYRHLSSSNVWKDTDENYNKLEYLVFKHSKHKLRSLHLIETQPFLEDLFPGCPIDTTSNWLSIDYEPILPIARFICRT